jgi:hypothetical protein
LRHDRGPAYEGPYGYGYGPAPYGYAPRYGSDGGWRGCAVTGTAGETVRSGPAVAGPDHHFARDGFSS